MCPTFWHSSKRWTPRWEEWQPHKLVGSAIHLGIALHLQAIRDGNGERQRPIEKALWWLGQEFHEQETWSLESLQALVRKGVKLAIEGIERDILFPGATLIAVEYTGPDPLPPGVSVPRILDCCMEFQGALQVWDWKSHIKLDPKYLAERQQSVAHNWQILDYGWHAQKWFGKPVTLVGTGEIILSPKAQFLPVPVVVTPARLAQWHKDAETIWHLMSLHATGDTELAPPPWHNWEACTDRHLFYGKSCPMYEGCHKLFGDERLFSGVYKEKER